MVIKRYLLIAYPCRSSGMDASMRSTFGLFVPRFRPRSSVPNFFGGRWPHSFKFSVKLCLKNPAMREEIDENININYVPDVIYSFIKQIDKQFSIIKIVIIIIMMMMMMMMMMVISIISKQKGEDSFLPEYAHFPFSHTYTRPCVSPI